MTARTPVSANLVVEDLLNQRALVLEEKLEGDVIAAQVPIDFGIDDLIRQAVEFRKEKRKSRKPKLCFFLETDGGYIEIAQRIVQTTRHHYKAVEFYVTNRAMSAGTVLVLSGDRIWMDYFSVLGPIDPQVRDQNGDLVPALGYLEKYAEFVDKDSNGKLTNLEAAYFVQRFDPATVYHFEQAKQQSITLLKEWLVKYKFKNWQLTRTRGHRVTPAMRRHRAEEIATILQDTRTWHSHGHGISMEVLRQRVGLEIDDFSGDQHTNDLIRLYYGLLSDYSMRQAARYAIHTKGMYFPIRVS